MSKGYNQSPMKLSILDTDIHVLNMRTRMPFRYGIATMTALPHLFLRVQVAVNGQPHWGLASDGLAPKWFTKNPETSTRHDVDEMLAVIRAACRHATAAGDGDSVFTLWQQVYTAQEGWAQEHGYPPLLWAFGVSLVERALIDAFCRATNTTFAAAVRSNTLGIKLDAIYPELAGVAPADLLPEQPLHRIAVRHTVGLGDPLYDEEISEAEQLRDGLPQSLAASVHAYGLTHFKIKIQGNVEADLDRLHRIAALLEAHVPGGAYAFTLDGNEQYRSVDEFRAFWEALAYGSTFDRFLAHLLFVEQPLHRDIALDPEVGEAFERWPQRPPLIIDESDGALDSARTALERGYNGASHKNCKGVFKGIANTCLIRQRQRQDPAGAYVVSGEDLANVGPVALIQDLAVLATLGIDHAERNGHHYFRGLSMLPAALQARVLATHADLYHKHAHGGEEFPALSITDGTIQIGSIVDAPFGIGFALDPTQFTPLADWRYASLHAIED